MTDRVDAAAVRIFPPAAPLATILAGIGLDRLWPIGLGVSLDAPGRYWVGGLIIASAVVGLGVWSVLIMRRTGQTENPWKPTTEIVETGPFRITRNPMYLQMVLVCIGMFVLLSNFWILLLTPACAWALHRFAILPEERYLEEKFGQSYNAYRRRVATSLSHEDEKAADLAETCPRDLILSDHLFEAIHDLDPSMAADAPRRWKLLAPIAAKAKIEKMPRPLTLFGKPKQKVWILRNAQRWKQETNPLAIEQELLRRE